MAGEPMSYWEYLKAAFWKPVRTRVFGAMPLTKMLLASFGLAGFFNPGFWLLGLATIVAFVGSRSASARFQKLMEAERMAARAGTAEDRMKAAYESLEPASQARYRSLVVVCREILGLGARADDAGLTDFRAPPVKIQRWGHDRWDIENRGFNELTALWHMDHYFIHDISAIETLLLTLALAFATTYLFYERNLTPRPPPPQPPRPRRPHGRRPYSPRWSQRLALGLKRPLPATRPSPPSSRPASCSPPNPRSRQKAASDRTPRESALLPRTFGPTPCARMRNPCKNGLPLDGE